MLLVLLAAPMCLCRQVKTRSDLGAEHQQAIRSAIQNIEIGIQAQRDEDRIMNKVCATLESIRPFGERETESKLTLYVVY
jgi:hypothetical protein